MPELADITYSRRRTIAAVTDYYKFLTKLYLKDSQVIYPPATGWPSIVNADANTRASLGKSEEVLSLLAHLPYIRSPSNFNDEAEGAPGCRFADWQDLIASLTRAEGPTTADDLRVLTEGATFSELAPPHVIGLTCGGRENPIMVLDTKLGIIHWEDCPSSIEEGNYSTTVEYEPPEGEDSDDSDEEIPEEEVEWRQSAPAWAVGTFFTVLKDQFKKLHWVPISQHMVWSAEFSVRPDAEGMVAMLQDIYREHGWPDLIHYRKADCLEAVRSTMKERYLSSVDPRENQAA
jgi:hypothetical protein